MMQEKRELLGRGGRQVVSAALVLTAALFFLPALMVGGEPVYQRPETGELPGGEAVLPLSFVSLLPSVASSVTSGVFSGAFSLGLLSWHPVRAVIANVRTAVVRSIFHFLFISE